MQKMTLEKIHTNFFTVFNNVIDGEEVEVLFGEQNQPVAKITPIPLGKKKRTMEETFGCLAHWGPVWFAPDYDEVDEEFYADNPNDPLNMCMKTFSTEQTANLDALVDNVARTKKPVEIRSKNNACVLLSAEEWRGMQETNYLKSIPGLWESIQEAANAPDSEFIKEEDFVWHE